jgi:hypothetical protein
MSYFSDLGRCRTSPQSEPKRTMMRSLSPSQFYEYTPYLGFLDSARSMRAKTNRL